MKAIFFTLIFQFLFQFGFQFMSLNAFANDLCSSDSILIKDSVPLLENKVSKNKISLNSNLLSKNQVKDFEKLKAKSDTTKNDEISSGANKKQKKSKKNRGKLLSVLTFLSAFIGLTLLVVGIVTRMAGGVGGIALLFTGLGFCLLALVIAYFTYSSISLFDQLTGSPHDFYQYLWRSGIQMAAVPFIFLLIALLLIIYTRLAGA